MQLPPKELANVRKRLRILGFPSLAAYYASPRWRATREWLYQSRTYRCERCGARHGLQVHHRTYKRLGWERLSDLMWVCDGCHEVVQLEMLRTWGRLSTGRKLLALVIGY